MNEVLEGHTEENFERVKRTIKKPFRVWGRII